MTIAQSIHHFHYVQEEDDRFLALFPHRFDYIWAEHPDTAVEVAWKTESRHPLSDRLVRQGAYLYGVRFGAETNYCLLDIDSSSLYHPDHDPFAISRIAAALEPLGLVSFVACTSSYSGGLHLYFPFQQRQSSWQLAIALACLLENAGFKLQPGQLEIFPNPKPYAIDGSFSLFNAHRLPMQTGSYLVNSVWQVVWSDSPTFVRQWITTQQRNDIDSKTLKQILKQAKRKHFGISGKAEKFINDLNTEIEAGWTGYGQTNRLLGRITMRAYIFHHVFSGGEPLQGVALVEEIVETARSLPGYQEWCRHQHEIEQRAEEWARCIENSHYFHFGYQIKTPASESQDPELAAAIDHAPSWNQRQSAATRDRIRQAIAELLEGDRLPAKPTARFQALLQYGIGGGSLYRHRDLWHPNYFFAESMAVSSTAVSLDDMAVSLDDFDQPVENSAHIKMDSQLDCVEDASNWLSPTSLLPGSGGDNPSGEASGDRQKDLAYANGSNAVPAVTLSQGVQYVQQVLFAVEVQQAASQEAAQLARVQRDRVESEAARQQQQVRMQQYLESGDPILMAEAVAWAQVHLTDRSG